MTKVFFPLEDVIQLATINIATNRLKNVMTEKMNKCK